MKFRVIPSPNTSLNPIIKNFFSIEAGETVKNDRLVLPTGRQYLIFHLKGEAWYTCNGKETRIRDRALLCHVQTSAYCIKVSPNFEALGASLSPNGLYRLFGKTFGRSDSFLSDSEAFLGNSELNALCAVMGRAADVQEKLELLENYLNHEILPMEEGDIVDRFLNYMGDFKKEITTRKIAAELFTNTRTLELKFCAITGTTPGRYIRLQRFNRLICDVASKQYRMRDLVAKHNYSDYSHMRRDIRKYSGVSLREIANADTLENTPMGVMM